jgi:NAD(P)-dependent dehydrogenase (short-subunit alcohol dehydrogenase family)
MDSPLDFNGKCVIITGGTKGMGRALVSGFQNAGADVVTCARNAPDDPLVDGDREAMFVAADVRDPEQVQAVVAAAVEAHGRVDVLINNAGGAPPAESATVSPRFNERIVALNLLAPITFAQAAYSVMSEQDGGGVILNISSVSGIRPNPMGVAYGAAKAGLINASETLAVEWGPKVRVLTVTVGLIVTDDARLFYGDDEGIRRVGDTIALGRMGDVDEIADVCVFLASPMARWMSGANIKVHGGGERPAYLGASTGDVTTT